MAWHVERQRVDLDFIRLMKMCQRKTPAVTSLYNSPQNVWNALYLNIITAILCLFSIHIWHCQTWLTNHAEECHQVSKGHSWPRACGRTHGHRKRQMSSTWERVEGRDVAYMAVPYQSLPLPWKGFLFSQAGRLARLTTTLWLFSLTASRACRHHGEGRSIMWWVSERHLSFFLFFFLQMWGLIICKTKFFIVIFIYLFLLNCQCVLGSCPVLYANATICLTRSKISTKVVCVHLSARPSAHVQWETIIFILSEMGSNS